MAIKITSRDTVTQLLQSIVSVLPPFFTRESGTKLYNMLYTIATALKINVDQVNQAFNNTFILHATGSARDELIQDISKIKRKNNESDEDYYTRFSKIVYQYNITPEQVDEIVNDIFGSYPERTIEGGTRAYYGLEDLDVDDRASGTAYYYNDIGDYTVYWGTVDQPFTAYIYLYEEPDDDIKDELCDVIEMMRIRGTEIYLVWPIELDSPIASEATDITTSSFTATWESYSL